jgi:hypothetical protein
LKTPTKLILDFDESYRTISPGESQVVLSSTYENDWTHDVRKFRKSKGDNVRAYTSAWANLINWNVLFKQSLQAYEYTFFNLVISPMSRWLEAIDFCFKSFNIVEVEFTSYTHNDRIFIFEAEGEINAELFYEKSFYLPKYLESYVSNKYQLKPVRRRCKRKMNVLMHYYFRIIIFFTFIVAKQILFKLTTFSRKYNISESSPSIIACSRAIVQTDFITNFLQTEKNVVLIANEQSFRLFKHKQYLKARKMGFFYAEGNISFKDIFVSLTDFYKKLSYKKHMGNVNFTYEGINIPFRKFYLDLIVRELDYVFYSKSIKNTIKKFVEADNVKLFSFEMFTPYSFYLKNTTSLKTYQVQTTLLERLTVPNFVGADKFFFTNPQTYDEFSLLNPQLKDKFGCLPFLKYIGKSRKDNSLSKLTPKIITYFTQPIDLQEEIEIINFLESYCEQNQINLILKPHPRQIKSFIPKSAFTAIADKYSSVEDLIFDSDLVVTRTSSIGLDSWIYGTPAVFLKLNENARQLDIFFAPHDYYATCTSLTEFSEVLADYPRLVREFQSHKLYIMTDMSSLTINDIE